MDAWPRPRQFQPCQFLPRNFISPTSAESGTPGRARLIQRLDARVRVSAFDD